MSRVKYKLTILFSVAAIVVGVSVVLGEFNPMIRPIGPIIAFDLREGGNGAYLVDFLGETFKVELPVNFASDLLEGIRTKSGRKNITDTCQDLLRHSEQDLQKLLSNLIDTVGRMLSEMMSRAGEIMEVSPLKDWFPTGKPEGGK